MGVLNEKVKYRRIMNETVNYNSVNKNVKSKVVVSGSLKVENTGNETVKQEYCEYSSEKIKYYE